MREEEKMDGSTLETQPPRADVGPKPTPSNEAPMWCDDFDMDLPKVIPGARDLLGDLANLELWTTGHETDGTLNHPTMWTTDRGMTAFFGLPGYQRPALYWTNDPPIRCTLWQAVRDMWVHQGVMLIDGAPVLDTEPLWRHFEKIMWGVRGWSGPNPAAVERSIKTVTRTLAGVPSLVRLRLPDGVGRAPRPSTPVDGAQ